MRRARPTGRRFFAWRWKLIEIKQEARVLHDHAEPPGKAQRAESGASAAQLVEAFDNADADHSVGAIVLNANGPAFCAGMDLKETSKSIRSSSRHPRAALHHHSPDPHADYRRRARGGSGRRNGAGGERPYCVREAGRALRADGDSHRALAGADLPRGGARDGRAAHCRAEPDRAGVHARRRRSITGW